MPYDHLSFQEKYSILISYLLKTFPGLFQEFMGFFSLPGLEIYLIIFLVFKVSQGAWEPWEGPLQCQEGKGSLCFHGLIFSSVYF